MNYEKSVSTYFDYQFMHFEVGATNFWSEWLHHSMTDSELRIRIKLISNPILTFLLTRITK